MGNKIEKSTTFYAADRAAWRAWLAENHLKSTGVWLVYFKKDSGRTRVQYAEAVEEALCFGWIDSTLNPIDEHSYMQLFTPRKPKSTWSKLNKERVEQLMEQGLMTPMGWEKIEIARQNGSWEVLDHVEAFIVPHDLEVALDKNKKARVFFEQMSKTGRKGVLHNINAAKLAETRRKRIDEIVNAMNEGRLPDRFYNKKTLEKKQNAEKGNL